MDDAAIGGIGFVKICRSWRLEFLLVGDLLVDLYDDIANF